MKKQSAGILLYRIINGSPEFLLVHPGGPFWQKKDLGVWSIPKGEFEEDEEPLQAAIREFEEETGTKLTGDFTPLTSLKQKSGKVIYAWALKGDMDVKGARSNTFEMEWPPRSGSKKEFPEWFDALEAKLKIVEGQQGFIEELMSIIAK